MLSEDECYELWHSKNGLVETIRLIYETGFNAGQKKVKKNGKQNVKQKSKTTETEEPF